MFGESFLCAKIDFDELISNIPEGRKDLFDNPLLKLKPQELFQEMYPKVLVDKGSAEEANKRMYSYFNCGVQLALTTSKENAEELIKRLEATGHKADIIGYVNKGEQGVTIESMFDNTTITYS